MRHWAICHSWLRISLSRRGTSRREDLPWGHMLLASSAQRQVSLTKNKCERFPSVSTPPCHPLTGDGSCSANPSMAIRLQRRTQSCRGMVTCTVSQVAATDHMSAMLPFLHSPLYHAGDWFLKFSSAVPHSQKKAEEDILPPCWSISIRIRSQVWERISLSMRGGANETAHSVLTEGKCK